MHVKRRKGREGRREGKEEEENKTIQARKNNPNSPRICVFVGFEVGFDLVFFWVGIVR